MRLRNSILLPALFVALCCALVYQIRRHTRIAERNQIDFAAQVEKAFDDLSIAYEEPSRHDQVVHYIEKELLEKHLHRAPGVLFDHALRFFVSRRLADNARALILHAHAQGYDRPGVAEPPLDMQAAVGAVHNLLAEDPAEDVKWCRDLREKKVIPAPEFDIELDRWLLADANALHDSKLRRETIAHLLANAPAETAVKILRSALLTVCSSDRAAAEQLLDLLKSVPNPAFEVLRCEIELRLHILKADWPVLIRLLPESRAILPDSQLYSALRVLFETARKTNQLPLFETVLADLAFTTPAKQFPHSLRQITSVWCEILYARDRAALAPALEKMVDAGLPTEDTAQIFCHYIYNYMPAEAETKNKASATDPLKRFIPVGQKIYAAITPTHLFYDSLKLALLDCSFLVEDYPLSFKLLETGIPGKDQPWIDSLVAKLRAHQAIKEGRWLDAVAAFRKFMEYLKANGDEETVDPSTGILYTKDAILAKNERRIAELLDKAGKHEEAKKARACARELFANALKRARDTETRKMIERETALVPAN